MEGSRNFSGVNTTLGKKYKLSRESLERLSFIQKPSCVFHSNSLHFPFHFPSLCLSLSLSSPLGPAKSSCYGDMIVVLLRD